MIYAAFSRQNTALKRKRKKEKHMKTSIMTCRSEEFIEKYFLHCHLILLVPRNVACNLPF